MTTPTRRHFPQTTIATVTFPILPRSLFAMNPDRSCWFIHADTLNSWPVADPAGWCLQNAHEPILERAAEGLAKLTKDDGDRIIRLVIRRCRLNLLELRSEQVVVQHWGQQLADLRPYFKSNGLARKEIEIVLKDCKKKSVTTQTGDDYLFGDRIATDFPVKLYLSKWERRFEQEADDWHAAPNTNSGFAWDGLEDNRIPWMALKSAWRHSTPMICLNCDTPTILTNIGLRPVGMFNRSPNFVNVCGTCRRSFRDDSVKDVRAWMVENLDAEVWPEYESVWNRKMLWEAKS